MQGREPVLTASGVTALILAVCALLGVTLTDVQIGALGQIASILVPFVLPLVAGLIARAKVSPVNGNPPTYLQDPSNVGEPGPANDPSEVTNEQIPRRHRDPEEHASQDFDNGPDHPEIRE